jgi:hypothetical protein
MWSPEELDDDLLRRATAAFSVIAPVVSSVKISGPFEPGEVQFMIQMLTTMPRCKVFKVSRDFMDQTTTVNWETIWRFLRGTSSGGVVKWNGKRSRPRRYYHFE